MVIKTEIEGNTYMSLQEKCYMSQEAQGKELLNRQL